MVNYKPSSSNSITIGGITKKIDSSWKLRMLYDMTANSSAPDAFTIVTGDTQQSYVAPTNEKFIILGVRFLTSAAGAAGFVIYEGDTEDAITNTKINIWACPNLANVWTEIACNVPHSINSGKYATLDPIGTNLSCVQLIGYEEPN